MLNDHRLASDGLHYWHRNFKLDVWNRNVSVSNFVQDVSNVASHIPVAHYCESSSTACQVQVAYPCLSTHMRMVNNTDMGSVNMDEMPLMSSCSAFNALEWEDKRRRIETLYFALNSVNANVLPSQEGQWNLWVCSNWVALSFLNVPCSNTINLCGEIDNTLEGLADSESTIGAYSLVKHMKHNR